MENFITVSEISLGTSSTKFKLKRKKTFAKQKTILLNSTICTVHVAHLCTSILISYTKMVVIATMKRNDWQVKHNFNRFCIHVAASKVQFACDWWLNGRGNITCSATSCMQNLQAMAAITLHNNAQCICANYIHMLSILLSLNRGASKSK